MAKIYARQVPPEYQESPLSYSNFGWKLVKEEPAA